MNKAVLKGSLWIISQQPPLSTTIMLTFSQMTKQWFKELA